MREASKLNVDRLGASPSESVYELPLSWWDARADAVRQPSFAYAVVAPFAFSVRAQKMRDDVYLAGAMQGEIDVECSRCAARYRHALRDSFRLVLEPAGNRIPADPEGAEALARDGLCLGDEIEAGWYRGSELELSSFFAEVVSLGMPVQPLCSDECLGLCPQCGVDRNETPCACRDEWKPESPFAVLASLKDDLRGE